MQNTLKIKRLTNWIKNYKKWWTDSHWYKPLLDRIRRSRKQYLFVQILDQYIIEKELKLTHNFSICFHLAIFIMFDWIEFNRKDKNQFNPIKIAVILSHPTPSLVSLAINLSRSSSTVFLKSLPFYINKPLTRFTRPSEFYTYFYQIPSHPMIINSSSFDLSNYFTSGSHVIICYL